MFLGSKFARLGAGKILNRGGRRGFRVAAEKNPCNPALD
jgi:hypothetical protein